MSDGLSFLQFFLTDDLYITKEDLAQAAGKEAPIKQQEELERPQANSAITKAEAKAVSPNIATETNTVTKEGKQVFFTPKKVEDLIFGKNLKKMLILVQDKKNAVLSKPDGLLLRDILKAIGYTFDDVAILNIEKCREKADWEVAQSIEYNFLFSFGIISSYFPATTTIAPYTWEKSGNTGFILSDSLSILNADKAKKIMLWNLLKETFV